MIHVFCGVSLDGNTPDGFISMQKECLEMLYSTVTTMDPSKAVIEMKLKICSANVFLILITSEMNVLLKRNTENCA